MSEHRKPTPGPWEVHEFHDETIFVVQPIEPGRGCRDVVVKMDAGPDYKPEKNERERANARLIAAAPDLLEALEGAVNCISRLVGGPGMAERINADPERYAGFLAVMQQGEAALAKAKGQEPAGEASR